MTWQASQPLADPIGTQFSRSFARQTYNSREGNNSDSLIRTLNQLRHRPAKPEEGSTPCKNEEWASTD